MGSGRGLPWNRDPRQDWKMVGGLRGVPLPMIHAAASGQSNFGQDNTGKHRHYRTDSQSGAAAVHIASKASLSLIEWQP
jgi:hypothetical protein